ncbi:hypothetical protein [Caballeronia sp. LZ034LL]|uniref:hypothetical protein n=1 Tax=Caballeronia sp. LZ034LL TaxID=3038567 RepID=UPI00285A8D38|nr:hypothetical protein [Caballeronia sp. LZ034LL]MDR5839327.1 hypothetical protein [Caballeronia sp. LZ034LL]
MNVDGPWEYISFADWLKNGNKFLPHTSRVFYEQDRAQIEPYLPDQDATEPGNTDQ